MNALIVWGGWDGHTPKETAELLAAGLRENGVAVRVENSLQPLEDVAALKALDLIVPVWTMGDMSDAQWQGLHQAVHDAGVGLGGVHGGMGDAFRNRLDYQWMVGGQFLGHPYVGPYTVRVRQPKNVIMEGLPKQFDYSSEQYYMQVDPGIDVLADTVYSYEGQAVNMPVVWVKSWGKGKVFYSALGHSAEELKKHPQVVEMSIKGLLWAAASKSACGSCAGCCGCG